MGGNGDFGARRQHLVQRLEPQLIGLAFSWCMGCGPIVHRSLHWVSNGGESGNAVCGRGMLKAGGAVLTVLSSSGWSLGVSYCQERDNRGAPSASCLHRKVASGHQGRRKRREGCVRVARVGETMLSSVLTLVIFGLRNGTIGVSNRDVDAGAQGLVTEANGEEL